jgi:hypothetical protein
MQDIFILSTGIIISQNHNCMGKSKDYGVMVGFLHRLQPCQGRGMGAERLPQAIINCGILINSSNDMQLCMPTSLEFKNRFKWAIP